ncbi:unnamed protein product [Arabis nemorensis]|uniref:Uncharacterized protein n=1 Tax=Arabis nemorensis TaxID=586526 RepID=A0A565ATM9_9BRAS|nr:unnamed protein product [Arabis nemorensis]
MMVEAVPALLDVVLVNSTSSSESDGDSESDSPTGKRISLSPKHERDLHNDPMTVVDSIIADDGENEVDESEFAWEKETNDPKVDDMVDLINKEHEFCNSMFSGGATRADVLRMIKEAKEKNNNVKGKKVRGRKKSSGRNVLRAQSSRPVDLASFVEGDCGAVVDIVDEKIRADINRLEMKVDDSSSQLQDLKSAFTILEADITAEIAQGMEKMKSEVINGINAFLDKSVGITGGTTNVRVERSNSNIVKRKNVEPVVLDGNHPQTKGDRTVEKETSSRTLLYPTLIFPWTIAGRVVQTCCCDQSASERLSDRTKTT